VVYLNGLEVTGSASLPDMLSQQFKLQLVRPPIAVRRAAACDLVEGTSGFGRHVFSPIPDDDSSDRIISDRFILPTDPRSNYLPL
jgi:hypothetical protein